MPKAVSFWAGWVLKFRAKNGVTRGYNGYKKSNSLSLTLKTNMRVQSESKSKFRGSK